MSTSGSLIDKGLEVLGLVEFSWFFWVFKAYVLLDSKVLIEGCCLFDLYGSSIGVDSFFNELSEVWCCRSIYF
jgi:hypothetical protein